MRGNLDGLVQRTTGSFEVPTGPFEVPIGIFEVSQNLYGSALDHLDAILERSETSMYFFWTPKYL